LEEKIGTCKNEKKRQQDIVEVVDHGIKKMSNDKAQM
jgi:hypothetical protein